MIINEKLSDDIIRIINEAVSYLERRKSHNHFQIMKLLIDHGMDMETMDTYPIGYLVIKEFYTRLDERNINYTNLDLGKNLFYPWLARLELVKNNTDNKIVYMYIDGQPYRMTRFNAKIKEEEIFLNRYIKRVAE